MSSHVTRSAHPLSATLTRTAVQRAQFSVPGREIVQIRTEIPAGVASGWHTHPGEEVGYIIAGTVQMEILERPTLVLNAGDGFCIPPGPPHNGYDLGPGPSISLSTCFVEVEQPISSAAAGP